jgi:heme-degrading monooxygenase HmoA
MPSISVINAIEVPPGYEELAVQVRNEYVAYFQNQPGFVSSTFLRSINSQNEFQFVNIVVWDSLESFENVVNRGFESAVGENEDGRRVLGKGFPAPIRVHPGQYEIIESTDASGNGPIPRTAE